MTEDEARHWVGQRWGRSAVERLEHFARLITNENERQNLVSANSLSAVWTRHVTDSAQLVPLGRDQAGLWVDIGTGGGFPGMVVAVLRDDPILLVEPRRRRAEFLASAISDLGTTNARVAQSRVEALTETAAIISARAVAAPSKLFALTTNVVNRDTLYILPSGRDSDDALLDAQRHWRGVFHVEQSVTEPTSRIVLAKGLSRI